MFPLTSVPFRVPICDPQPWVCPFALRRSQRQDLPRSHACAFVEGRGTQVAKPSSWLGFASVALFLYRVCVCGGWVGGWGGVEDSKLLVAACGCLWQAFSERPNLQNQKTTHHAGFCHIVAPGCLRSAEATSKERAQRVPFSERARLRKLMQDAAFCKVGQFSCCRACGICGIAASFG